MYGYKTYQFRHKDPDIQVLKDAMNLLGMTIPKVSEASGVPESTLHSWFDKKGKTRMPRSVGLKAVAIALHGQFKFIPSNVVPIRRRKAA